MLPNARLPEYQGGPSRGDFRKSLTISFLSGLIPLAVGVLGLILS